MVKRSRGVFRRFLLVWLVFCWFLLVFGGGWHSFADLQKGDSEVWWQVQMLIVMCEYRMDQLHWHLSGLLYDASVEGTLSVENIMDRE